MARVRRSMRARKVLRRSAGENPPGAQEAQPAGQRAHADQPREPPPDARRSPSPGRARAAPPGRRRRTTSSIPHIRKRVSPAPMRIPSSAKTTPLSGISAANSHQISCARSTTALVVGERVREHVGRARAARARSRRRRPPTTGSRAAPPRAPARRRRPRAAARPSPARRSPARRARARGRRTAGTRSGARPSEAAPTRASTAEATRNEPSSAPVRTAISRADPHQRPHAREQRRLEARRAAGPATNASAHPGLGDHGAPRRAGEAPAEAVDEQHLEHDVDRVGDDEDHQRRAQVADPAQEALAGGRDHEERRAERRDPQVQHGAVGDLALAAHQRARRPARARPWRRAARARGTSASHSACEPSAGGLARRGRRRAGARPARSCRR